MRDKLLHLVKSKGDLPPLPEVLLRLEGKIGDPNSCHEDIAELIQTEPVLHGRLMRLANSVFFGGGRDKTTDLTDAVGRLGLKMVLDMAYTLKLPGLFSKIKGINQKQFWYHALVAAVCSRSVSRLLADPFEDQENAYLAGLMHDIGILVFAYLIPDEYAEFLRKVPPIKKPLHIQEQEKFEIAHPELGAAFIKKWWPVAPAAVKAVKNHHLPLGDKGFIAVIVANRIVNAQEITNGTNAFIEPQEEGLEEQLGLSAEDAESVIKETQEALTTAQSLFAQ